MTRIGIRLALCVALGLGPATGAGADTALILANSAYVAAPQMRGAGQIARLQGDLAAAGFDVLVLRNATADEMRGGLSRLIAARETERIVVVAAGHFVQSGGDSWILGTQAQAPDLAQVGGEGVPVSVLAEIAASAPGRAIVALATEETRIETGAGLARGIGRIEPPQGVTVLVGPPEAVAAFVSGPLLTPGTDLPGVLDALPDLRVSGFVSASVPFLPETARPPRPEIPEAERQMWRAVVQIDNRAAYEAYLDRYPRGAYAEIARARLLAMRPPSPEAQAQAREDALGLSRDDRRQLQHYLTILSFDTGGADGVFGPATRRAIGNWQVDRGLVRTGYLDAEQVAALRNEGTIREAVLAEERRQAEREDRAWWRATGSGSSLDGMRAYLERYPNGLFAEQARLAIADADAAGAEAAWRRAQSIDTIEAYRGFLLTHPDSRFAAAARARIAVLRAGPGPGDPEGAEVREAALNLPPVTRLLVEQRLTRLGFEPGPVDGTFDAATRRAIRAYQQTQRLPPTGYLDETVVTALLAGGLADILR